MQQDTQAESRRRVSRADRTATDAPAPAAGEAGYRRRRLAEVRAQRMRRLRVGLMGAGALALLVLLVLAGGRLLSAAGGGQDGEAEGGAQAAGGALLLMVEHEGRAGAGVFLGAGASPATLLGVPPGTLVESSTGFRTLAELWGQEPEAAREALGALLGLPAGAVSVSWTALGEAVGSAGGELEWPATFPEDGQEAASLAVQAVASLCQEGERAGEAARDLGEASEGDGLDEVLASLAGRIERVELLPGKAVRGPDFSYYEPDTRSVRALVSGGGTDVEVEVQNGSGVVGVTEAVTAVLQGQGFQLLPVRNADAFPGVERTQVLAAGDALGEAESVRSALGVGQVIPQEELPARRIVVIVGNDLEIGDLSAAGAAPDSEPAAVGGGG
jgi:hypothetical protein